MVDSGTLEQTSALWPQALAQAKRACAGTLARLRRGDGGFYQADDLLQDLFCAWAELCQQHVDDETALWRAWSGLLYAGGRQILRRPPQRLWYPRQIALAEHTPLPACPMQGERAQLAQERLSAVTGALWRLPTYQRQVIYWRAICGLTARQTADHLGAETASIDTSLSRARENLRRIIYEQESGS